MTSSNTNTVPTVQGYLFFDGRCEEALEYYREVAGAEITSIMRFKDNPEPAANSAAQGDGCGGGSPDKVMHADFLIGNTHLMASDGNCGGQPKFEGFGLAVNCATVVEAERLFNAFSRDGHAVMPLGKTFFSPGFGMVADKFGVMWMTVTIPDQPTK